MKKVYTLIIAALASAAALAQSHPTNTARLPRPGKACAELPARFAAPHKADGQVLPINLADPVKLYTHEQYSWEGHYDYYFSFANSDDEFYFPMVFFDLYLPTAEGLTEGTYTLSDGTIDPNLMLMANYNDYTYYYYGYAAYEWSEATISLTKGEGNDVWTVDFSATSTEGYTYTFSYTGEFTVEPDDFDPDAVEPTPDPEDNYTFDYEPDEPSQFDIVFNTPDTSDGYVDEYKVFDIFLEEQEKHPDGRFFESHLYLITNEHKPHADYYPVNSSEALNTFLASKGCPAGSSNDTPCFLRTADETYVYDSWYIVAGQIALSYNAENEMVLEGNVATQKGSEIHFTTANATGINSVLTDGTMPSPAKFVRDGKVYINGGHFLYTPAGQRVK